MEIKYLTKHGSIYIQKIEGEKARAVAEARTEVALLATEIAARILKREVSAVDNKAVAEDFFREMR
jgi:F0F1-type ATP synthase membrane subunit b/b'